MIHHIVLYKLKPGTTAEHVEKLLMQTRMQLLKIPVAMNVRCSRRIDQQNEWPFFLAVEFDSKERMAMFSEDPVYRKYRSENYQAEYSRRAGLGLETDPSANRLEILSQL
jgi:hypothetical protein